MKIEEPITEREREREKGSPTCPDPDDGGQPLDRRLAELDAVEILPQVLLEFADALHVMQVTDAHLSVLLLQQLRVAGHLGCRGDGSDDDDDDDGGGGDDDETMMIVMR